MLKRTMVTLKLLALVLCQCWAVASPSNVPSSGPWSGSAHDVPDNLLAPMHITAVITGDQDVCAGDVETYSYPNTPGYTYVWSVSNGVGTPSTTNTFQVTWQPGTLGQVSVIVKDLSGVPVASATLPITIRPQPQPFIIPSSAPECTEIEREGQPGSDKRDTTDCFQACDSSHIIYSTPNNPGSTYQWIVNGAISFIPSGNQVDVFWGAPGQGSVRVIETNQWGCTNEAEVCIEIIPSPDALFTTVPAPSGGVLNICLNQTVSFVDLSTTNGGSPINSWFWDFGDGNNSTVREPDHVYAGPGSYTVVLTVTNECNCVDRDTLIINVGADPGPIIECPSTVCAGATETYTTPTICTAYNWSVTGGTIQGLPPYGNTITVTWGNGSNGYGTVSLDGASCPGGCPQPTVIRVPIIPPTINISGPNPACTNDVSFYSIPTLPCVSYNWVITPAGAGTIVSGQGTEDVEIFWNVGATSATLTVDYFNPLLDCGGSGTLNVNMRPPFTISGPTEVCNLTSNNYTAPTAAYDWTLTSSSGATLSSATATSSFNVNWTYGPGVYNVTAINTDGSYCNSPQTVEVIVSPIPPAITDVVGTDSICPNASYLYTASPTSSEYYLVWDINNGVANGSGTARTITWDASGPYSINIYQVQVASPNCSSAVFTKNIAERMAVTPVITGDLTPCANSIENYLSTPTDADDYQWTITPNIYGSIKTGQGTANPEIQWNNTTGTCTLTVVSTTCTTQKTSFVVVNVIGAPTPTITAPDSVCALTNVNFSVSPSGSAYSWTFGDGATSSAASPTHQYATNGTYNVTVTVTNPGGCVGVKTASHIINVKPAPVANITTPDPRVFCIPDPVNATLYASNQGAGHSYQWTLNGSNILGATGLTYPANAAGTYRVVVTNSFGCSTTSNAITLSTSTCTPSTCNPQPYTTGFTWSINSPDCKEVQFTNTVIGGTIVRWNFDDPQSGSNTSTALNPTHVFTESGYYNVRLRIRVPNTTPPPNNCVIDTTITVYIPIAAEFYTEFNCGSTPGTFDVDFFDESNYVGSAINSWTWTIDGNTYNTQNTTVSLAPGSYNVTLQISNGTDNCEITQTVDVPAVATAIATGDIQQCQGNTAVFTDVSTGGIVEWLWTFGDGASSALQNPVREYTLTGNPYDVILTVTDSFGCMDMDTHQIVIDSNSLVVSIVALDSTTLCQGESVDLVAVVSGGNTPYNYLWSNVETNDTITVDQTGDYFVIVTDNKQCVKQSNSVPVTVNYVPPAVINGRTEFCDDDDVELFMSQGPSYNYSWFVNGTPSGTGAELVYPAGLTIPGTITVKGVLTDPATGCKDSATVTITIHPTPPQPSISGGNTCEGSPVLLTASSTVASPTFVWSTGQTGPSITVISSARYEVTVIDTNGCTNDNFTDIYPLPTFEDMMTGCYEFCDTGITLCGPSRSDYSSFQWLFNGSPIPGGTFQSHFIPSGNPVTNSGQYQVIVTTIYGCVDTSDVIDVELIVCDTCEGQYFFEWIKCEGPCDDKMNYSFSLNVFNPFGGPAVLTLSSNLGPISGLSPIILNPGNNSVTGTFANCYYPDSTFLCISGEITFNNGDITERCEFEVCEKLPPCEFDRCDVELKEAFAFCKEQLPNGLASKYYFEIDFNYNGPGGIISSVLSPQWTISGLHGTIVNNGNNRLSGYITDDQPFDQSGCMYIYIYDCETRRVCEFEVCLDLPDCEFRECEIDIDPHFYCASPIGQSNGSINYTSDDYIFDLNINYTGNPGSILQVCSPDGVVDCVTPTTLVNGYNGITGTFHNTSGQTNICLEVIIYDPATRETCKRVICYDLPKCEPITHCDQVPKMHHFECYCVDNCDNRLYKFGFQIENPYCDGANLLIKSDQGTIMDVNPIQLTSGTNVVTGVFIHEPPYTTPVCFTFIISCPKDQEACYQEWCIDELEPCEGFSFIGNGDGKQGDQTQWLGGKGSDKAGDGDITGSGPALELAPNPASDYTMISYTFSGQSTNNSIQVNDMYGKTLQVFDRLDATGEIRFSTANLSAGTYTFVAYEGDALVATRKLIVVKR